MKESYLKKEFKESDIQRARNLVNKDYISKTKQQAGYSKVKKRYKEGDIWEESGKTWTIKNGIKQNITKLDKAKKSLRVPLACPKCGTSMNYHLHKKMYKIHGFCFDCTIDYEAELRKAGLYEKYEQSMITGNIGAWVNDFEAYILDSLNDVSTYHTEDGVVEDWQDIGADMKNKISSELTEFVKKTREHLSIYS